MIGVPCEDKRTGAEDKVDDEDMIILCAADRAVPLEEHSSKATQLSFRAYCAANGVGRRIKGKRRSC